VSQEIVVSEALPSLPRGIEAFSVAQRRVIVTGGARGIGRAIARRFMDDGATVAVIDRSPRSAADVDVAAHVTADLARPDECVGAFDEVIRKLGDVDVLINNAAIIQSMSIEDVSADFIADLSAVNFTAPVLLCREFARHCGQRQAQIVNIASSGGVRVSFPGNTVYGSLKAALAMATAYLAKELGPQMRVNAIAPGSIASGHAHTSPASEERSRQLRQRIVERTALRRLGEPDEVAALAVFLASDASRYITGQTVLIDGGWLLD